MKNKNLIFVISICILLFSVCNAQWVQIGPPEEDVQAVVISGSNVLAGTWDSGVLLSTDNGQNWAQTTLNTQWSDSNYQYISELSVSGSNVYAGTNTKDFWNLFGSIYLSTDYGRNWMLTSWNNGNSLHALSVSDSNVFAGTSDGVYRSTDNGQNWIQTALNNGYVSSLAVDDSNVFAGSDDAVFRSTNNGQNWTQVLQGNYLIAASVSNVFAGSYGIYRSTNNGQNWIKTSLDSLYISALAVSGSIVFAGTWDYSDVYVYLSIDNGETWSQINEGLGNQPIYSLAISSEYIYAGTRGASVWRRPLSEIITSVEEQESVLPNNFILQQNYPNPFNPTTTIGYSIPNSEFVTLKVYDVLGNEVATLVNEEKLAGNYDVEFDSHSGTIRNLSSGIYFYALQAGSYTQTKKLILMK